MFEQHQTTNRRLTAGGGSISNRQMAHFPSGARNPHLHCVVPGGGLAPDGSRWISCRKRFFLPVRVLSRLFRRVFLELLRAAFDAGELTLKGSLETVADAQAFADMIQTARSTEWVVYAKPPFGGPRRVLDYLGRYTHRIALSNHRLLAMHGSSVRFRWGDYRHGNAQRLMTLEANQFIRRFLLHVLPEGYVRMRYFGLLANCHRRETLSRCRILLGEAQHADAAPPELSDWTTLLEALTGVDPLQCPKCRQGRLVHFELLSPTQRAPPFDVPR